MANRAAESGPSRLLIVVAAALMDQAGKLLVQRRPVGKQHGGLWEFPGGKLEVGETPEAALIRELAEELAIVVDPTGLEPAAFASESSGERPLLLLLYLVRRWMGEPRLGDAGAALAWMSIDSLADLPMPPADRPLVAAIRRVLA